MVLGFSLSFICSNKLKLTPKSKEKKNKPIYIHIQIA